MGEIHICEKPDYIDFDEIHQLLYAAHETTRTMGIHFWTADMSGEELENYLSERNATCLVALDGDKVVGTMSFFIREMHWKVENGTYLELVLIGVLPKYKGNHIFSSLYSFAESYAMECHLDGVTVGTAAANKPMRQALKKKGFFATNYGFGPKMKCYTVRYLLYFNKPRHSKLYCLAYYQAKKVYIHLQFGKTGRKRF